jgi:hypothetical protein
MEKIVCFINLFTTNQRVYLTDSNSNDLKPLGEIPLQELEEKLVDLCELTQNNSITLIGSPSFADEIVPEIMKYAKLKYNNNEITVEVMR